MRALMWILLCVMTKLRTSRVRYILFFSFFFFFLALGVYFSGEERKERRRLGRRMCVLWAGFMVLRDLRSCLFRGWIYLDTRQVDVSHVRTSDSNCRGEVLIYALAWLNTGHRCRAGSASRAPFELYNIHSFSTTSRRRRTSSRRASSRLDNRLGRHYLFHNARLQNGLWMNLVLESARLVCMCCSKFR
ncbi:hypothetical protein CC78DRAFT_386265 [Lojkania enalia]|uniref:Uncharacterized protein n=1 Tax=Lojkania enalia TaxID=147567 RepID=A0A9P4N3F6_9PLEO|nr:hypothetical protein CC78DRAFT_386265 [Didymosphaeria enalia]